MGDLVYTATLRIYEDGTCVVTGDTIRGLVLETSTFDEMRAEMARIVPLLLHSNHRVTAEQMPHVELRVTVHDVAHDTDSASTRGHVSVPRVLWEDHACGTAMTPAYA